MSDATSRTRDYDDIAAVFQKYIAGAKSGRSSDMKAAFDEKATIFGYVGADIWGGEINKFFEYNDRNGPAKDIQVRIASIDVANTVATARLEIDDWTGHQYTDFFTLLKVGGQWKIINKVFHVYPEAPTR